MKTATLYAYVSRGLVRRAGASGSARRYLREDLARLAARSEARSGHGPVAAAALRWGEPVLGTRVSFLDARGPCYRGTPAAHLAREGVSFERAAELLWTGALPREAASWAPRALPRFSGYEPLGAMLQALASVAAEQRGLDALDDARGLVAALPTVFGARVAEPALHAERVGAALGVTPSKERARVLDATLVLLAEHELNPSTFAARVASSAGSTLGASLVAALATLTGSRHGRASDALEALLARVGSTRNLGRSLRALWDAGEDAPCFGHPAYPAGDPRATVLLELASELAPRDPVVRLLDALCRAMEEQGRPPPNVDAGLVAARAALGLPAGAAPVLFALARSAGWVAHALEQREEGATLRPRARYLGELTA